MSSRLLLKPLSCITCRRVYTQRGGFFDYGQGIIECRNQKACERRAGKPQQYVTRAVAPPWADEPARRYAIWIDGFPEPFQCAHRPVVGRPLYITRNRNFYPWTEVFIEGERHTQLMPPLDHVFVARQDENTARLRENKVTFK